MQRPPQMRPLPDDVCSVLCDFLGPTDVDHLIKAISCKIDWDLYCDTYANRFLKKRISGLRNVCADSISALYRLIKMYENKTYSFDSFWSEQSLDNVNVPIETYIDRSGAATRQIPRITNIMKSFIIKGKNIRSVEIRIGGASVWKTTICHKNYVRIQPFDFGIILCALRYHEVLLNIDADNIDYCKYTYLYLDLEDINQLCTGSLRFSYINPSDPERPHTIRYRDGMAGLC